MELDELKKIWKEESSRLEKRISLNEQALKNIFTKKTKGLIEGWLKWEYFSLAEFIIILVFVGFRTYNFIEDLRFLIPASFLILFLTACIILAIKEIKQLKGIDLYSKSIVDTKEEFLKYKKGSNQAMKVFLFLIPLVIPSFILISTESARNLFLQSLEYFLLVSIGTIILSYIIAFIFYWKIILRKFRIIESNLEELEKFKEE